MMIIDFNIFYLTPEQVGLEENGISVPFSDCDMKTVTFYDISYVTVRRDDPNYTIIGSGGQEFTCNEKVDTVRQKIKEASIFKFN